MRGGEGRKRNTRTAAARRTPRKDDRGAARVRERNCSVARTLGICRTPGRSSSSARRSSAPRRFETFRSSLGLPRATLIERLKRLTGRASSAGALLGNLAARRISAHQGGTRALSCFIALMQFGDRWLAAPKAAVCGSSITPATACAGRSSRARVPGRGAARARAIARPGRRLLRRRRRDGRGDPPTLAVPARAAKLGFQHAATDRRPLELPHHPRGVPRLAPLRPAAVRLKIASNILSDRLARLVATGIFGRRYQNQPERFEYRLTDMGKDLYGPLIAMMAWAIAGSSARRSAADPHASRLRQGFHAGRDLRPLPQAGRLARHGLSAQLRSAGLRRAGGARPARRACAAKARLNSACLDSAPPHWSSNASN